MQATNFILTDYFSRIDYTGPSEPNKDSLRQLMRAHLFSVPFENLDVQAGKIVSLVLEDIVEKIVYRKRGGYCYEVNGLFSMALEAMGFEYYFVAARPMFYPVRRPKTHMSVVVKYEGEEWLCDLGFGSFGLRAPLSLNELDQPIQQDDDFYKLTKNSKNMYLLQALVDGEWANQYEFDLYPHEWIDFMPVNYLNSTHPDAIFVQKLLVIQHSLQGRKILLGQRLKAMTHGVVEITDLQDDEVSRVLQEEFNLTRDGQ